LVVFAVLVNKENVDGRGLRMLYSLQKYTEHSELFRVHVSPLQSAHSLEEREKAHPNPSMENVLLKILLN